MKKIISFILLILLTQISLAQENNSVQAQEDQSVKKWEANWESLRSRPYPDWFKEAKLGIFIHWGVSSVPAYGGPESYGEWFLRGLQVDDPRRTSFQKRVYGEDFTYRDYAPLLKGELFDADEWAQLFKRSGAKYIIFVSKHHDGYCFWPSKYAPSWNSVDVGPKRDVVGELTDATRKAGLKMGLYYSLTEWNNPLHRWYTDPNDEIGAYVEQHMLPQFKELISTYKPSLIFTDGEWYNKASDFHAAELIAWYFNLVGDEAIVNNRWGGGSNIGFLTPEYSAGLKITDRPWAEVRGLGRSFGLNRNEKLEAYMSAEELIHFFIKAVANGGGITINVGPKADGQIPLLQQERLVKLGEWIHVNSEAIYGSETWEKQSEEKDVVLKRIDPEINFNWVRNTPGKPIVEDNFTATWEGYIEAPSSGEYLFEAKVDDGMRLWIDNKLVIDKWEKSTESADGNVMTNAVRTKEEGKIELTADKKYPIKIVYFENKQNAMLRLFWSNKDQEKQIVPQQVLFSSKDKLSGDGLKAVYKSKAEYLCYTKNNGNVYAISLEWPGKELILPINIKEKNIKISLLGKEGNLDYNFTDGKIHVDLSNIYHNDLPCLNAWTFKIEGLD
ncbi:MAG: alpha-L-fucosidase [Bacteroidota bacterium]